MKESEDLIEQFMHGDEKAFETLVLLYKNSGQQFAQRYISNFHISEDIVQDAFVTCYMNRHKYKHNYSFKTYFYTIVRNKCIDYIRHENRRLLYQINDSTKDISTEETLIQKETLNSLKTILSELHKPYKQAIYLVDIEGCSYKEAARITDKTLASFKITLYRARKQLKNEFNKEANNESWW